jgi:CubicO group peptidase (beta-lactamase class C family)
MPNTTLSFDVVQAGDNYALPHTMDMAPDAAYQPIPLAMEQLLSPAAPAGAHWSTARDMANYMITQLSRGIAPDGTRVVSAENLGVTWQPQVPVDATSHYGLGWIVGAYKDLPLLHHGGNTFGFTSDFAFMPDAGLGIIVLTNGRATNAFNESVRTRLFELVFDQQPEAEQTLGFALEQAEQQVVEFSAQISATLDTAALEPFLGAYTHDSLGDLSLALADGRLTADVGEFRFSLKPLVDADGAPDGYLIVDGPVAGGRVRLQQDGAGKPELVLDAIITSYTFVWAE